jgi:hypothetical protein
MPIRLELYDAPSYNEVMKVTALIPDKLVKEVQGYAKGKNLTESLILALSEWNQQQKIRELKQSVHSHPLSFSTGFSALHIRAINRKS